MPIITMQTMINSIIRSSRPEVLLVKSILKIYNKFTGEHPCRSMISVNLLCNFIEINLWYGCSPVNLPHIFRTLFLGIPLGGCFSIMYRVQTLHILS